jgi:hypothetical protein
MWLPGQTTQSNFFSPGFKMFFEVCAGITAAGAAAKTLYSLYQFVWPRYTARKETINKFAARGRAVYMEVSKPFYLVPLGAYARTAHSGNVRLLCWMLLFVMAGLTVINVSVRRPIPTGSAMRCDRASTLDRSYCCPLEPPAGHRDLRGPEA